jgi:hypothetical protein
MGLLLKTGCDSVQVGEAGGSKSQNSHRNTGKHPRSGRPSFSSAGSDQNDDASDNGYYLGHRCGIPDIIQHLAASTQRPSGAEQTERHDRNGAQGKGFGEARTNQTRFSGNIWIVVICLPGQERLTKLACHAEP